jgi:hypothetical protein
MEFGGSPQCGGSGVRYEVMKGLNRRMVLKLISTRLNGGRGLFRTS